MAIKSKAKVKGDSVEVKVLMKHAMETGLRKDSKTGELIPAHHITEVSCVHNGKEAFHCNMGPAIAKNPYLAFTIQGPSQGDMLTIHTLDNTGITDVGETMVK